MDLEDITGILYLSGMLLLSFGLVRFYGKKKEIRENFPYVHEKLNSQFKRTNIYEYPEKFRELHQIISEFNESIDNESLPSLREWNHARKLMDEYHLWKNQ